MEIISLFLEVQSVLVSWIEGLKKDTAFEPEYSGTQQKLEGVLAQGQASENSSSENPSPVLEDCSSETPSESEVEMESNMRQHFVVEASPVVAVSDTKETKETVVKRSQNSETIRIASFRLDQLIQLIGELSISQSIVWHANREKIMNTQTAQSALNSCNKITKEIQGVTLSLRMQNLEGLFQRLERVIRDVSSQMGKKVRVVTSGGDVELDRTVIESVTDPLIHIARNAIDHGIETNIEDRVAAGKSETAVIRLDATQTASGVTISVNDDGRGLNEEKLVKKAIEKGLIPKNHNLTQDQIFNLIALPGFSTAEKVTEISGRGVGMDVVKRSIEKLRGKMSIDSKLGKGSQFKIELPTSVSIADALIVGLSGQRYAIPVHEMEEIVDLYEMSVEWKTKIGGLTTLRDEVLPVFRLEQILSTSSQGNKSDLKPEVEHHPAIVVRNGKKRVLFTFEKIISQQQIVMRPLDQKLKGLQGFSGNAIFSDGEPGLIIDLPFLAQQFIGEANDVKMEAA
jgi:two-component system chemotaxis sensor kinase CheA